MTGQAVRKLGNATLGPACRALARLPLPPSLYAFAGALLGVAAGILFLAGRPDAGLAAVFLAGLFDYLDGGVSRAKARRGIPPRRWAPAAHAASDKVSDTAILAGLVLGGMVSWPLGLAAALLGLASTALTGLLVGHGYDPDTSLFDRSDRIVALLVLGLFHLWTAVVVVVIFLGLTCVLQRLVFLKTLLRQRGSRASKSPVRPRL